MRAAHSSPSSPRPPLDARLTSGSGRPQGTEAQDISEVDGADSLAEFDSLVVGAPTWNTGADEQRTSTAWDDLFEEIDGLDLGGAPPPLPEPRHRGSWFARAPARAIPRRRRPGPPRPPVRTPRAAAPAATDRPPAPPPALPPPASAEPRAPKIPFSSPPTLSSTPQRLTPFRLAPSPPTGKPVAIFGLGDSSSYGDNFCDAIEEMHGHFASAGAKMVGYVSTDGYTFDDSKSVVDGQFLGLPLDEDSEDDLTEGRYTAWVEQIKGEGVN